jgi:hypothetical protein
MTLYDAEIEVRRGKTVETLHARFEAPGIHEAATRVDRDVRARRGWVIQHSHIGPAAGQSRANTELRDA